MVSSFHQTVHFPEGISWSVVKYLLWKKELHFILKLQSVLFTRVVYINMIKNYHQFAQLRPCQCWHIHPMLRAWLHLECNVVKSSTTAGPCGIPIPIFLLFCLGFVHVHPGMGKLKSFRIRNPHLQHILSLTDPRDKITHLFTPFL